MELNREILHLKRSPEVMLISVPSRTSSVIHRMVISGRDFRQLCKFISMTYTEGKVSAHVIEQTILEFNTNGETYNASVLSKRLTLTDVGKYTFLVLRAYMSNCIDSNPCITKSGYFGAVEDLL